MQVSHNSYNLFFTHTHGKKKGKKKGQDNVMASAEKSLLVLIGIFILHRPRMPQLPHFDVLMDLNAPLSPMK